MANSAWNASGDYFETCTDHRVEMVLKLTTIGILESLLLAVYSPLAGRGRLETDVVYKGRMAAGEPKTETAPTLVPIGARLLAWSMG